jgi:D-aminopeptidase
MPTLRLLLRPLPLAALVLTCAVVCRRIGRRRSRRPAPARATSASRPASSRRVRHNAITDVAGVRVGQVTLHRGRDACAPASPPSSRTASNAYLCPASQPRCTSATASGSSPAARSSPSSGETRDADPPHLHALCVEGRRRDGGEWMLERPGMQSVRSINPVVGETNDGGLNDIRARPITAAMPCAAALETATDRSRRRRERGCGDGHRRLRVERRHRHGVARAPGLARRMDRSACSCSRTSAASCTVDGVPRWARELGQYAFQRRTSPVTLPGRGRGAADGNGDGSVIIIIATDAPAHRPQPRPRGRARDDGTRSHRQLGVERQRRLRARLLHRRVSSARV